MFWKVAVTTAVLASSVGAEIRPLSMDQTIEVRAVDVLERNYEDVANRYIEKRQTAAVDGVWIPKSEVTLNPDGSINMTAWEEETSQKCTDALSHLDQASNPSGTCICYNLPSLDAKSGVFEADLRLYKVSDANGAFSGIPPQNIQVGLSFNGASVSPISANNSGGSTGTTARRDVGFEAPWSTLQKRAVAPQLLQTYLFVGQIDPARMTASMSMYEFPVSLFISAPRIANQAQVTTGSARDADSDAHWC